MAGTASSRTAPFHAMVGTKPTIDTRRSQRLSHGAKAAALAAAIPLALPEPEPAAKPNVKRPGSPIATPPGAVARPKRSKVRSTETDIKDAPPLLSPEEASLCTTLKQPKLAFDLQQAKEHLCQRDARFTNLFAQMDLKMYDEMRDGELKELNLFRVLTTSILGQQISWLAARSILYKFCRVFAPHLEEKPDFATLNRDKLPFPNPHTVLEATDEQLRTAGLSTAKIKYVRDVARRFADGRLDVRRIVQMSHEECIEELTKVKGVGRWTAEMLLMFALRFPDVLPVGDLGVQRGIVFFYTSGSNGPMVNEHKRKADAQVVPLSEEAQAALPSTQLTSATLRARANGAKTKKKMYLDADEMEELAAPWAPYRSVACMFMWSIIDN